MDLTQQIQPGEITLTVQISIPISLTFDRPMSFDHVRECALENFLDHPALTGENIADLEAYIDSIANGDLDLTKPYCRACKGKGWLLADNSDHGLRIERCDECRQFESDEAAVTWVARRASGWKVSR